MSDLLRGWDPTPSLRRHLQSLIGERSPVGTPEALRRAEAYVEEVFRGAGYPVTIEPIAIARGNWSNVIADRPGEPGRPLFVIGAHLDAVEGSPGADDNASGVAALLTVAEKIAEIPAAKDPIALRFAAFNLEEWGMVGSAEHAEKIAAEGRAFAGMIALEMIGYADPSPRSQRYPPGFGVGRRKSGDFISVVADTGSRPLMRRVAEAFRAQEGLPVETLGIPRAAALLIGATLSDHSPFWQRGLPAVMVGDTAFYRNPNYHLPSDTLETLSIPFLEKVTRGLASFAASLLTG